MHFLLLLRSEYPALVRTLEEIKVEFKDGSAEQREKARKADQLLSEFYNVPFALRLALLCDIYRVYSTASQILQVYQRLSNNFNNSVFIDCELLATCEIRAV